MNDSTECQLYNGGWTCNGPFNGWQIVEKVEPSHFITETLLPLGFAAVAFAVAVFVIAAAFTLIYHHIKLAEWRLAGDDDEAPSPQATVFDAQKEG